MASQEGVPNVNLRNGPRAGLDLVELNPRFANDAFLVKEAVQLGTWPYVRVIGMALGWNGCRGKLRGMAVLECERRGITRETLRRVRLVPAGDAL